MEALLFFVGFIHGSLIEYLVHRYLFHGLGKKKDSIFAYHLRDHHLVSRRNDFIDNKLSVHEAIGVVFLVALHVPAFFLSLYLFAGIAHEAIGVVFLVALHVPAFFLSTYLFAGIAFYAFLFVALHNTMHKTPGLAKKYFWWHWNHHMKNQNKSWNVVLPIFDLLTGTLQKKD